MIRRSELKARAKAQIKGDTKILFGCNLAMSSILLIAIISVLSVVVDALLTGVLPPFAAMIFPGIMLVISLVIVPAFALSGVKLYLALSRSIRPQDKDIFKGFKRAEGHIIVCAKYSRGFVVTFHQFDGSLVTAFFIHIIRANII